MIQRSARAARLLAGSSRAHPSNDEVARVLERVAELLRAQHANPYRIQAYREAARRVRETSTSVARLACSEPLAALERLPGIGASIGMAIREYAGSGRLGMLDRLEGQVSPEDLFASVPGIGDELARRIHSHLGIETLEELELAAHNGQLEKVLGATDDWVIIYYERNGDEGQATVVTERRGALVGRRVVRGREAECRAHYLPL